MMLHDRLVKEIIAKDRSKIDLSIYEDQAFLCRVLLHAADLSNPTRNFRVAKIWADLISSEFSNQVTNEEALGIKVNAWMRSNNLLESVTKEIGFVENVARPMWSAIVELFPWNDHLLTQLDQNTANYKQLKKELEAEEVKKTPQENLLKLV